MNCSESRRVGVVCRAMAGVRCEGERQFVRPMPCRYVTGSRFDVAMGLSVFLGIFGIDRCYLGYPVAGAIKLFTLGGAFILAMMDVVLLATGWLQPADGSDFLLQPNGPRLRLGRDTALEVEWRDVNWVRAMMNNNNTSTTTLFQQ